MALDASTSYGAALGLAGTPKDYSTQFTRLGMQQDAAAQRKEQAKQAKKDKEEEERNRVMKMWRIAPGTMHPKKIPVAQKALADYYIALKDKVQQGIDPSSDPEFLQRDAEIKLLLKSLENENSIYEKDKSLASQKPLDFYLDDPFDDKNFDENRIYTGGGLKSKSTWQDQAMAVADKIGTEKVETKTPEGYVTVLETLPEKNLYIAEQFLLKGLPDANGQIPDFRAKKLLDDTQNELMQDEFFKTLPVDQQINKIEAAAKDKYVKFLESQQKREQTITPPSKGITINMGSGSTDTGRAVGTGKKTFNINFKTTAGGVKTGEATSLDGATFKEAEVKATLPDDAISMINGERIKPVGVQKIRGGEMQLVYTYKKGTKSPEGIDLSGNILPDQNVTEGQLESGAVVPKLLFLGEIQQQGADGRETSIPFYSSADAILKNFDVISTSGEKNKDYIVKQYEKLKQKEKEETDKIVGTKTQQQPNKVKPGDVRDGYEFLGGDPNKQSSWRKIK